MDALGVAIAVNAGATLVYSARVMDAYTPKQSSTANTEETLCWKIFFHRSAIGAC